MSWLLVLCTGMTHVSAQIAQATGKNQQTTRPGCPETPLSNPQRVLALSELMTQKDLEKILSYLEVIESCGVLDPISEEIDRFHAERRDVRTAILMVRTLANGPVDLNDTHTLNAVKLIGHQVEKLGEDTQWVLLGYAAQKLGNSEETEALLTFARGNLQDWVEPTIIAVNQPVARGPWNPPGGQAIPFYIGNEAHKAIVAHYVAAHDTESVRVNSVPISAMLIEMARNGIGPAENANAQAKGARAARPDIVNLTTSEIYEIKPVGAEAAARALVAKHVATFAAAGITMTPGRPWSPGVDGVVPAPGGHYVFYGYDKGVILYRYQRGDYVPAAVPVPGESRAAQMLGAYDNRNKSSLKRSVEGFWDTMEEATGLTGIGLGIYIVVSEGSRIAFPPRNLIPVP